LVNEATANRIIKVAERLGYRPNAVARGLKTRRSGSIGVLVPDLLNPVIPPIVRGIEGRLAEAGYNVLLCNADHSEARERIHLEAIRSHQIEGLITANVHHDASPIDPILASGRPVVLVNRVAGEGTLSAAYPDDELCSELAVGHLAELGHRRIAHVAGPGDTSTGVGRLRGFRRALRVHGLKSADSAVIVSKRYTEDEGKRCCSQLIARGTEFTAVYAANDLLAVGCYDALNDVGLGCPSDVSVVGCNDMPFTDRFSPPLTTVNIAHGRLGAAAAELMLEALADPDAQPRQIVIEPTLVVRGSTALARSARISDAGPACR
jgi:LacI family transcriptional regulator